MDTIQFEQSVLLGDRQAVRKFVKNSRHKLPEWLTPALSYKMLCKSVSNRDSSMVALLLKLRPVLDFECESKTLVSPLWTSVIDTHIEIARLLLDAGADVHRRLGPNATRDPNSTMLHYLLSPGGPQDNEFAKLLLKYGADVNAVDSKGKTPLHYTLTISRRSQIYELVDLLLKYGADVYAMDSKGNTPLHYLVKSNNVILISKLLSKGADVNARNVEGDTPILMSCRNNAMMETVNFLIENGADICAYNNRGCNVLHVLAMSLFDVSCVAEIFLKKRVPMYMDFEKQYTPLHYSIRNGNAKMTKLFLEHGADANRGSTSSVPPLLMALSQEAPLVIEALLMHGADLEYKSKRGRTPLHIACRNVMEKNITVLLEYGANINALDDDDATPFSLINFKNGNKANQAMIRAMAKRTALNEPVNETDLGIIKEHPKQQEFYDKCLQEIEAMKKTKLFYNLSYFAMFSKNLVKLAILLRDSRFKFPMQLRQIKILFPIYAKEFNRALHKAKLMFADLYHTEDLVNSIFFDELPSPILRKLVYSLMPPYAYA